MYGEGVPTGILPLPLDLPLVGLLDLPLPLVGLLLFLRLGLLDRDLLFLRWGLLSFLRGSGSGVVPRGFGRGFGALGFGSAGAWGGVGGGPAGGAGKALWVPRGLTCRAFTLDAIAVLLGFL